MATETYTMEELEKQEDRSDAERVKNMTDEEIEEAAKSDPDSALPTDEELKQFKRPSDEYRKRFQNDKD
ncbi:hypothetical protein [Algicola sagamiensis]|uniref:hypothetical protein n=1 Tax=Algicola sagamiensis TaxID=163869 RepID=UPI0003793A10|nr:hypothetical protein [Algicola sagamiensis]